MTQQSGPGLWPGIYQLYGLSPDSDFSNLNFFFRNIRTTVFICNDYKILCVFSAVGVCYR